MKYILITLFIISSVVYSQQSKIDLPGKTKALEFLIGEWEGGAWFSFGKDDKTIINQTEDVRWMVDKEVVVIEGIGVDANTGEKVHHAYAIVYFDITVNKFKMMTYKEGRSRVIDFELTEGKGFQWGFDIPNYGKVKYKMNINENGQWYEYGEFSRDGKTWYKNFEMTLTKK